MGHEVIDSPHGLERNNRPNNHERIHSRLREARHVTGLVAFFVIYSAISYAIINWGVNVIQQGEDGIAVKAFLNGIDPNTLNAVQYLMAGFTGLLGVKAKVNPSLPSLGFGSSTVRDEKPISFSSNESSIDAARRRDYQRSVSHHSATYTSDKDGGGYY